MSYRIQYAQASPKGFGHKRKSTAPLVWAAAIAGGILLACLAMPQEAQRLRQALFPWTLPQVWDAFGEMTQGLRAGESLGSAVTAFCREILREATPIA